MNAILKQSHCIFSVVFISKYAIKEIKREIFLKNAENNRDV